MNELKRFSRKSGDEIMLRPEILKATYHIGINCDLYEEIRINETWNETGVPVHSDRFDEGYIWSELYGQSNEEPFDKWAYNYHMSFQNGTGTPESFFEKHFSQEEIRRRALGFLYPDKDCNISQQEYYKTDPRISWLYYKRNFDAVFPVICELGKTQLDMELEGKLDDNRLLRFTYASDAQGSLFVNGEHLADVCFYDEKYKYSKKAQQLEIGKPVNKNGKWMVELYGVHSFSDLLEGLEMTVQKADFYKQQAAGKGGEVIYRLRTYWGGENIYAKRTEYSEMELIQMGAEKLVYPEVDGKKIGLFYWNFDASVKTMGGYVQQAFYPDTYRLLKDSDEGENGSTKQHYEYYMVFDGLEDLEGWYPLDRFIWEDDPEPEKESDLRHIILELFPDIS